VKNSREPVKSLTADQNFSKAHTVDTARQVSGENPVFRRFLARNSRHRSLSEWLLLFHLGSMWATTARVAPGANDWHDGAEQASLSTVSHDSENLIQLQKQSASC